MYPQEYVDYLIHFHGTRDYFECHEIMEEYWKEQPPKSRNKVWAGLIQIAVSMYHHRRGNFPGAHKMLGSAIRMLSDTAQSTQLKELGLDVPELLCLLSKRLKEIEQRKPYTAINFPICDQQLLQECGTICARSGLVWGATDDTTNEALVHKHTLRDRSDVIEERLKEWRRKQEVRVNKEQ